MFKKNISVIILYVFLGVFAVFPIVFRLNSLVYGTATDPFVWIWNFWWLKYSLVKGLSSNFVPILAYPFGLNLLGLYTIWGFLNKWLTVLTGEVAAYNLQIMCSFFLSGLAMYYLIYYFTKSRLASFFSGVVFMFCPYHFARSWDHISLSNVHWMVFYILSLFNLYQKKTFKNAFICGICFSLIGQFSSYYYVYFMMLFTVLFVVFNIVYNISKKRRIGIKEIFQFLKLLIIYLTAIVLIMLPQIWRYIKMVIYRTDKAWEIELIRPFGQLFADSARPLNYFLPVEYNPFLGGLASFFIDTPLYGENSGGEQSLYLGFIPLILAFIGYKRWRKNKIKGIDNPKIDYLMWFWIIALFIFMICSFSPYWGNKNSFFIPFPSLVLYRVFPMFRNYARMGVIVMMSVCVLAGFGLKGVLERFNSNKKKLGVVFLLCCGVCFEFFNIPPITDVSNIPKVYNWLKLQPENIVVAEYPIDADTRPIVFYQRVHQKNLVNGAVPGTYAYEVRQKVIGLEDESTAGILSFLDADYVLVHKDKYLNSQGGNVLGQVPDLDNNSGFKFVKDFGNIAVYEVVAEPIDPKIVTVEPTPITFILEQPKDLRPPKMSFGFKEGDRFKYAVKYMGIVPVLNLDIDLKKGGMVDGNETMFINANIFSSGLLSYFFDVTMRVQSLFDINNFWNYNYEETIQLKHKVKNKKAIFDRKSCIMMTKDRKVKIKQHTQDPLSAIFFLSGLDFSMQKQFDIFINPGKTNYKMHAKIKGKTFLIYKKKKEKCWYVEADIFKSNKNSKKIGHLKMWFEDSEKKTIKRVKAFTNIGIINLELKTLSSDKKFKDK